MMKFVITPPSFLVTLLVVTPPLATAHEEWNFAVMADVHGMTGLAYVASNDAPKSRIWNEYAPVLQNIYDSYGGEKRLEESSWP